MKVSDFKKQIDEILSFLQVPILQAYHPLRLIKVARNGSCRESLTNGVLFFVFSTFVTLFFSAIFTGEFLLEKFSSLLGRYLLYSLVFFPISFSFFIFYNDSLKRKIKSSFNICIYFFTFYFIPVSLLMIIFILSENYIYYYLYYLMYFLLIASFVIILPFVIHPKMKRKIIGVFIAIALYFLTNISVYAMLYSLNSNIDNLLNYDPILAEYIEYDVQQNSKMEYITSTGLIINSYTKDFLLSSEDKKAINEQVEALDLFQPNLITLLDKLKFTTNKRYIQFSLTQISLLREYNAQIQRLSLSTDSMKDLDTKSRIIEELGAQIEEISSAIEEISANNIENDLIIMSDNTISRLKDIIGLESDVEFSVDLLFEYLKKIEEQISELTESIKQTGIETNVIVIKELNYLVSKMTEESQVMNDHIKKQNFLIKLKRIIPFVP